MKCVECQKEIKIGACWCENCQRLILPICQFNNHKYKNLCVECLKLKDFELYLEIVSQFEEVVDQNVLIVGCVECHGTGQESKNLTGKDQ
jgi:hypothetical protein